MQNKTTFTGIIRENQGLIYKVAKLYTSTREDGEDLYQEIVYQLWKSFENFRNESKISTWIYRIALNTAIAYLNKEKKKVKHAAIDETFVFADDATDGAALERIEQLYTHIKKLNTVEKGIVLLYLEGKSYEEIAAITGFTITNVGTRLGRIRQKLSSQLKK